MFFYSIYDKQFEMTKSISLANFWDYMVSQYIGKIFTHFSMYLHVSGIKITTTSVFCSFIIGESELYKSALIK